jgi:hypothetical protein
MAKRRRRFGVGRSVTSAGSMLGGRRGHTRSVPSRSGKVSVLRLGPSGPKKEKLKSFREKRKRAKMDKKEQEGIFSKSLICFVTISKVNKNYGFRFS